MKMKVISCLLCFVMIFAYLPLETYAINITEEVLYEQDFESYLAGMSLENTGMRRADAATGFHDIIEDPLNDANYCGRYMKKTSGEMFLVQSFPSTLTGTITLSFSFLTTSSAYSTMQFWGESEKGTDVQILTCEFINFACSGVKLKTDEWNEIAMKLDTENDTSEIIVNGKSAGIKEMTSDVKSLRYYRMNLIENDKEMYIDNLKVTRSWKPLKIVEDKNFTSEQNTTKRPSDGKLYVKDFGAKCNDDKSDLVAIDKALRAAEELGDVELVFDNGRYDMSFDGTKVPRVFNASNLKNVKLTGNGCELYITSPFCGAMDFSKSENLSVEGFEIKYAIAPWIQGEVEKTNIEDGSFTFKVMEGYDLWSNPDFEKFDSTHFAAPIDNDNPNMLRQDLQDYLAVNIGEKIGKNLYKLTITEPWLVKGGSIKDGDKIVVTSRLVGLGTLWSEKSKNLTLKDIIIHESADTIMTGVNLEGVSTFDHIVTKLDGDRWVTANADGFHMQVSRGPITIKNCEIEGLLDDCVNLYQYAGSVTSKNANNQFTISHSHGSYPKIGDTIIIYNRSNGQERGRAKIISCTNNGSKLDVTLDKDILGVSVGVDLKSRDAYFVEELRAQGSHITNNLFSLSRRYGILMKAADAVIEDNIFRDLGHNAINFTGGIANDNTEGAFSENVVIKNNIFDNVAYRDQVRRGGTNSRGASISIPGYGSESKVHKNISIECNTFTDIPQVAISANGVDGLKISENKFIGTSNERVVASDAGALYIKNSNNIVISDNIVDDFRTNATDLIYIDNKCDVPSLSGNVFKHNDNVNEVVIQSAILKPDIPILKDSPNIDGDLSDWKKYHEFTVDSFENAYLFPSYTPEDLSFVGRYAWDENNFYLGVKVTDDVHRPGNARDINNIWLYDSVQIAFDGERIKGFGILGHVDLELTDGGVVNRLSTVAGIPNGQVLGVDLKVVRNEKAKTTTYEVAIPWSEIMPDSFKPELKKYMGVSMLVNDNDTTSRKGYLQYFSGIGNGKSPSEYATALLVENEDDINVSFEFIDTMTHWAKRYIEEMAFSGIINGVGDNMFVPEANVTVAEFISMLLRTENYKMNEYRGVLSDVFEGDWYANAIQTAIDNGMIDGVFINNDKINPNSSLSRAMAAALIVKTKGFFRTTNKEYDLPGIDYRYRYYMACAIDNGIFTGYDDGSFEPNNSLTRAEAAVILSNIIKMN